MKKYSEKYSLGTLEQNLRERKKPQVIKIMLLERPELLYQRAIWIFERR